MRETGEAEVKKPKEQQEPGRRLRQDIAQTRASRAGSARGRERHGHVEQDGDTAPGAPGSEEAHAQQGGVGEQQSKPRDKQTGPRPPGGVWHPVTAQIAHTVC